MNIQVDATSSNLASATLNSKIRLHVVVGCGVEVFHSSPPNCVTRSPGYCWHQVGNSTDLVKEEGINVSQNSDNFNILLIVLCSLRCGLFSTRVQLDICICIESKNNKFLKVALQTSYSILTFCEFHDLHSETIILKVHVNILPCGSVSHISKSPIFYNANHDHQKCLTIIIFV